MGDKIKLVGNKIKLIDPNNFTNQYNGGVFDDRGLNMSVPLEDLSILVELTTHSKGRSVLITEDNSNITRTSRGINVGFNKPISFISGSKDVTTGGEDYLTTKYTELSTQLDSIEETLGITSIDIEFNSSYAPMININFIDVRGGSLFQSNGKSSYNVFFRLPYPLFELKVKGYYGKPVKYCLHMLKCNTRFNSQTGNFEINAKFVGYTYALLSDMLIGYLKAAGGTTRGKELLKERDCPSINNFITKISDIDGIVKKLLTAENENASNLTYIKRLEQNVTSQEILLNNTISNLNQSTKYPVYQTSDPLIVYVKDPEPTTLAGAAFADYDNESITMKNFQTQYGNLIKEYNSIPSNIPQLKIEDGLRVIKMVVKLSDLFSGSISIKDKIKNSYSVNPNSQNNVDLILKRLQDGAKNFKSINSDAYLKIYDFTYIGNSIKNTNTALIQEDKGLSTSLAIDLKNEITSALGFEPNIRNIVKIFTTHIEVFLEQLFEVASKYNDTIRLNELNKFKANMDVGDIIYPFPEYNENNVEKYLGAKGVLTNPENVPEIKFVNELFDKMLTDEELLNNITTNIEAGKVAWTATNPIDTQLYNDLSPYDRLSDNATPDDVARLVLLRAISFLNYSNTYLSPDEINTFASNEAKLIINKFNDSKIILRGISEKYNSPDSYSTISGIINGVTSKILEDSGTNWKYSYINLSIPDLPESNIFLLPIDTGFNNGKYSFKGDSTANFNLSSLFCDLPAFTVNGIVQDTTPNVTYIDIIDRYKYDEPNVRTPIDGSSTSFNFSVLKTPEISSYNTMKEAGFSIGQGKFGIQEFTSVNYSTSEYGINEASFCSIFYENSPNILTIPPAVCDTRKTQLLVGRDLSNEKNELINFSPIAFDPKDAQFINTTNEVEKNHENRGRNINFFNIKDNQDQIAYPFFDFASVGILSTTGKDISVSTNLFGSWFYNIQGLQGRALLFLHNFPWRGLVGNPEKIGIFSQPEILNIFRYRTGFIQVPKLLPAFIGGLLWRYDEGERGVDPIIFKSITEDWVLPIFNRDSITGNVFGNNTPTHKEYMKYTLDKINIRYDKSNFPMSFCAGAGGKYVELDPVLINLPRDVKDLFIKEFNDFVSNEFNNSIRPIFEITPKNAGTLGNDEAWINSFTNINNNTLMQGDKVISNVNNIESNVEITNSSFKDRYKIFNYYSTKYGGYTDMNNNYIIEYLHNSDAENKLKELFFDYKYISNQSWRIWNEDAKKNNNDECSSLITINKTNSFNPYINAINVKLQEKIDTDGKTKYSNNDNEQIKFEIYRNLKKIYDKWIAFTDKPDKIIFQCCTTNSGTPTRLSKDSEISKKFGGSGVPRLIDSFRFVTRSFRDIGNEFQINPLMVFQMLRETTNINFYDFIGRILTDNNFDFIALPTFIDYNKDDELLSIFKPYSYYEAVEKTTTSGPSFVCVYVGQTSTKLDFGNSSEYPNDGFNLTDDVSGLPKDMTLTANTWEDIGAAFVVNYGQQNQNIFKDVMLDQSEFGETAESLQITDSIANKFSQTNQSYVGQNLYNVYSVRSYKTEVEMLGDAMIQPMMYFQLDNIPMFRGAYLITKVKHSIVPNHMLTTFTGTRIKLNETPLVDVPTLYSAILNGYELPSPRSGSNLNASLGNNYIDKYYDILTNNLPTNKVIFGSVLNGTNITKTSLNELKSFDFGRIDEDNMVPTISNYFTSIKIGTYTDQPWSSAFISYVMKSADSNFPASALHYDYVTAAMNGTAGYEVFPLKAGLTIKAEVGDILTIPNPERGYTASHSNLIYKIDKNIAYIVGGNREIKNGGGTVKESTMRLDESDNIIDANIGPYKIIIKKTNNKYYAAKQLSSLPTNLVVSSALLSPNNSIKIVEPSADDKAIYLEILSGLGAPPTDENLKYLYAWREAEGAKATFNPFNTTWSSGFRTTNYNSVGVKNYSTRADGISATIKTINQSYYKKIKAGLVNNIGASKIASYIDELKLWGTGTGVNRVLAGKKLIPPPIATV